MPGNQEIVGLVAGSGDFPVQFVSNASKDGVQVVIVAHKGETSLEIENFGHPVVWVKLGQLGKIIKTFKAKKVSRVAFAGGISRPNIFKGNISLDFKSIALLAKVKSVKDDVLLRAIAAEMEREGLEVFSATRFLPDSVPSVGTLTKRTLTVDEISDTIFGWQAAKAIGQLDIGQTVIVSKGMIVAVEAIEGTDRAIDRAGQLTQNGGGVVVKVCKPHQDLRLDLPTIGTKTIESMANAGLKALVVEAGKTIILNPVEVVRLANMHGICITATDTSLKLTA